MTGDPVVTAAALTGPELVPGATPEGSVAFPIRPRPAALGTGLEVAERTGEHLDRSETPTAVLDWYGPSDLAALAALGGAEPEPDDGLAAMLERDGRWTYAELSPLSHVRGDIPPVFVAHGVDDHVVPVEQNRELVAGLRAAGATVDYLEKVI